MCVDANAPRVCVDVLSVCEWEHGGVLKGWLAEKERERPVPG